ncbi:MAG: hypothetical protein KatS3mg014_1456 [Actinomycetota bacterium]|nr:MAG: hypothetical protein KatS3mg014_1456 [Actinomycetota bacterium]
MTTGPDVNPPRPGFSNNWTRGGDDVVARVPSDVREGWETYAACRGADTSLFFAPNYFERREEKLAREAKAKAICARCPVREPCLEYALRIRDPHGIWGGLNELERRRLLRARELAG